MLTICGHSHRRCRSQALKPALYRMAADWQVLGRRNPPLTEPERAPPPSKSLSFLPRGGSPPPGFTLPAPQRQYCIRHVGCIGCNGCVDVCPQNILRTSS
jgi:hypothetical protein